MQTIKAANEGLEKAEDLISQMKAIAEQVNTGSYVPEKEYFIKEVGNNGAVVSTAEELLKRNYKKQSKKPRKKNKVITLTKINSTRLCCNMMR